MLAEAEAIPYEPAPLRGERLLVLAPHPDDEVIACGGLMALHAREGRAVRVVTATDGTKATGVSGDTLDYRDKREHESRRGLGLIGVADVHFLRFPDRGLDGTVASALREQLLDFRPDLVALPSPVEIHPDHLALARAFCELIQNDSILFADLATTRIAFYEVSQPLRPNSLLDITSVADAKYAAIAAHESQIELKDYVAYARGLNAYRAMTLPPETKLAEGYWVTALPALRTTAFSALRKAVGHPMEIESIRETLPVSVIIRTKNRPALLREAIESVRTSGYPADVVVVNDGGPRFEFSDVQLVEHESSLGRSEAMNSGVRAAKSKFITFLDDDDLFYPEHLPTLTAAAAAAPEKLAWYSDAISSFLRLGSAGQFETQSRQRLFMQDFDRDLLLVDNYIPLITLLVERQRFLDLGGFDPAFDLFEDWDFLIRLSALGDFARVPRVTCEVRHFQGAGSIVLESPEGSAKFRKAKLRIWAKHRHRLSDDVFAAVYERQKSLLQKLGSELVEARGRRTHAEVDIARLERDKAQLIREIQDLHTRVNAEMLHVQRLQGSIDELRPLAERATMLAAENSELRTALHGAQTALQAAQTESERLQGLLDMIFKSRTWKLHTFVDRMRGRR
jgi:LmbE family N-acetylglucosaminyl deacetylase/GT2 family glycosyltransferase